MASQVMRKQTWSSIHTDVPDLGPDILVQHDECGQTKSGEQGKKGCIGTVHGASLYYLHTPVRAQVKNAE
jgi:hypothetical protein